MIIIAGDFIVITPYFKRVFLIVLDSVGIGEAPDAHLFGDVGADTLGHIAQHVNGLNMPNMGKLGLSNIKTIKGIQKTNNPMAYYGKMQEASQSKDTLTGHWELMGIILREKFRTYPNGFDNTLIEKLEMMTGRKIIGNKVASGTEIIRELGEEQQRTGSLIVYTSADSVLQIAAHEEVIPLEELYHICKIARELTKDPKYLVGRVIARPFIGSDGNFIRTANRRDYALKPFGRTVLDELKNAQYDVIALGKIYDIFDGQGITNHVHTTSNDDGLDKLILHMENNFKGLAFLNLVDFDSVYGHRRDPDGYAQALEAFDQRLPEVLEKLQDDDLLMITADHGNDPTFNGTDHTREYVPLLIYHNRIKRGRSLGIRKTFADAGATIAQNFNVPLPKYGNSIFDEIRSTKGE